MNDFYQSCAQLRFIGDQDRDDSDDADASRAVAVLEGSALEVRDTVAPRLQRVMRDVCERIQLDSEVRFFVRADPNPQAYALAYDRRHPVIVVNSGLVTLCEPDDLAFVLGHELGHLGFRHRSCEFTASNGAVNHGELLRRRAAEISADRIGLIACQSTISATKAILKVASGLPLGMLQLDCDAYLAQVTQTDAQTHAGSTHPSLPLRLRALMLFQRSRACRIRIGSGMDGLELSEVDATIRTELRCAGDDSIDKLVDTQVERIRAWAAGVLAEERHVNANARDQLLNELLSPELARNVSSAIRTAGKPVAYDRLLASLGQLRMLPNEAQERALVALRAVAHAAGERFDGCTLERAYSERK